MDITTDYINSILVHNKQIGESDNQTLARFIGQSMSNTLYKLSDLYKSGNIYHDPDSNIFTARGVVHSLVDGIKNSDLRMGLSRYTMQIDGPLESWNIEPPPAPTYKGETPNDIVRIVVDSPTVTFHDKYQWDYSPGVDPYATSTYELGHQVVRLLNDKGIPMQDQRILSVIHSLNNIKTEIGRPDGLLLTKYGYANDFKVTGSFSIPGEKLTIDVNETFFA